jgi:hypothetical protein
MTYAVIASAAKQSISAATKVDCFVATAPLRKRFAFVAGNDGDGPLIVATMRMSA